MLSITSTSSFVKSRLSSLVVSPETLFLFMSKWSKVVEWSLLSGCFLGLMSSSFSGVVVSGNGVEGVAGGLSVGRVGSKGRRCGMIAGVVVVAGCFGCIDGEGCFG